MPIIKRVEKIKKTTIGLRIDEGTAADLKLYSEYTNVPVSDIAEKLFRHEINSNAEFMLTICNKSSSKTPTETKVQPKVTVA